MLAQLAADGRDDRDRQVGRAAERAHRHRLQPCEGGEDGLDAPDALHEPDGPRDLLDDGLRQRLVGRR